MTAILQLGDFAVLNCKDVSSVPLESVAAIPAMVLESIGPFHHAVNVPFHDSQARGKAILIRTGWDQLRGTPTFDQPGPYLHEDLIFRLIRARVRLVGFDFAGSGYQDLIEKDIPVVEYLANLKAIPAWTSRFFAVPPRVPGTSAPVRPFVILNSGDSV